MPAEGFEGDAGGRRLPRIAAMVGGAVAVAALLGLLGRGAAPPPAPDEPGALEVVAATAPPASEDGEGPAPVAAADEAPVEVDPITGEAASGSSAGAPRPPLPLGEDWYCPGVTPVPAYRTPDSGGFYVLPGHPTAPERDVEPQSCWPSAEAAEAGGYRAARVPAGTEQIGELFLVDTGQPLREACQEAANDLGFAVPCPGVLPNVPNTSPCASTGGALSGCVYRPYDQQRVLGEPTAFVLEVPRPLDDADVEGLVIAAAPATTPNPGLVACTGDADALERLGVQQCPQGIPLVAGFGGQPHADRVLENSVVDGIVYATSLDPILPEVRRRVADSLELVPPTS